MDLLKQISKRHMSKDDAAKLLKTTPEALEAFEKAYAKASIYADAEDDNFFAINSKEASEEHGKNKGKYGPSPVGLILRIVEELKAQTVTYTYDGKKSEILYGLPCKENPVTLNEINSLVEEDRPQLTGRLMKRDINAESSDAILGMLKMFIEDEDPKKRQHAYHMFRQGLDILDLDPITYEIIGTNKTSIGHWFPQLVDAYGKSDFFKIPKTTIAKVPMTLLQLTRNDYMGLTASTMSIVNMWAYDVFHLKDDGDYFIKTGTYSSKFDFRNCRATTMKEVRELGEYLLFIHHQALQYASPLNTPCIYGMSTTNEWCVREYIKDVEENPTIYHGLPLHTEYRLFVDCDTDEIIGAAPYWESETMKKRFSEGNDKDSPHQIHDYVIYKAHEDKLYERYNANVEKVKAAVKEHLAELNLEGQWSLDIMQNGDDFWLIDMAPAQRSAFYDCVNPALRKPMSENWIPQFKEEV